MRAKNKKSTSEVYHVPFALVAPGVLEPGRVNTVAGQVDILPTLVDLFHIDVPYSAMGKSLLENPAKDWTFVTYEEDDFGFITAQGFIPFDKADSDKHRDMVALNKAVRTTLKNNVWAK